MTILEDHLSRLKAQCPGVVEHALPDGRFLVHMPRLALPPGKWSKKETDVWFLVPVGYPQAPPDCFWAESDLVLASGAPPQSTQQQPAPDGQQRLWFSWHAQNWHPSRDTLSSWIHMLRRRFEEGR